MTKRKNQQQRQKGRSGKSGPKHPDVSRGMIGMSRVPRNYSANHVLGVAQSLRRTLGWAVGGAASVAAGYAEQAVVLLNSPYDPDAALGGASAGGFAKYMALYSKCFTISARIRIRLSAAGVGNVGVATSAVTVGMTITTNTTSLGSAVAAVQAGLVNYELMNINPDRVELNNAVDIAKFVDKPDILDDPQFFCTAAANPAQLICLHFWTNNQSVVATSTVQYLIEVEYDVIFTDPIPFT
jgi:hypothetical protein